MEQEKELEILARLERIERTLRIGLSRVMDAQACADYLGITLQRVYNMTSCCEIPHYKRGKSVYFSKEEIDRWLLGRKVMTNDELEDCAAAYAGGGRKRKTYGGKD